MIPIFRAYWLAPAASTQTPASAMGGVESVKKNAASPVVDLTEAAAEKG
ncbi:hypothetical protein [Arthrobacter sp. ok362]|nr:hypothetical protein [Arthrobacter sp. ok362]